MEDSNDIEKSYEILKKYSKEVIYPCFGIDNFSGSYTDGAGFAQLPSFYNAFENTEYYHKGEKRFIHFTSLETLFQIINSGYFMANQLSSLDDPLELLHAGKFLESATDEKQFKDLKEYLFSLSMCQYIEANSDSFPIWNMYGKNGYGIGIVFSFYDNFSEWQDSYLAPVQYGDENNCRERFKTFSELHKEFVIQHPDFALNGNWRGDKARISDTISIFLAFHKSRLYTDETEIRYLKSFIRGSGEFSSSNNSIGIKLNSKKEKIYFYKIPIFNKEKLERYWKETPKNKVGNFTQEFRRDNTIIKDFVKDEPFIIIEKVILGYRYNKIDLDKIEKSIQAEVSEKLKWVFGGFELSNLSREFYGES